MLADRERYCPLFGLSPALITPESSQSGGSGVLPVRRIGGAVISHHPYETPFFDYDQTANVMVYPDDKNIPVSGLATDWSILSIVLAVASSALGCVVVTVV
jgi:hypothetical protein